MLNYIFEAKKRINHVQNLFVVNNYCQVKKNVSCIYII